MTLAHQISLPCTALSQTVAIVSSPPAAHDSVWACVVFFRLGTPILRHVYAHTDSHETALVVRESLVDVPMVAIKVNRKSAAVSAVVGRP